MDGLYKNFKDVPWDNARWPNFAPDESTLACPCCGAFYLDHRMFDWLQAARTEIGRAFVINSGHRCRDHNLSVGGREFSQHLRLAFDISTNGHDRHDLRRALAAAGFSTFGYYGTFIHTDARKGRIWYSKEGRKLWLKS